MIHKLSSIIFYPWSLFKRFLNMPLTTRWTITPESIGKNEAGSVLIISVNKNKIPYRPRTADPSTLTLDNLLTLANIITTSGIDHHHPPSLGVLTSVQVTMLYLQENLRQQALANIFGTSPTHYLQGDQ